MRCRPLAATCAAALIASTLCAVPPFGGTFGVSPDEGVSPSTSFTLTAAGWSEGEGQTPLQYQFLYAQSATPSTMNSLNSYSTTNSTIAVLPAGPLVLYARVRDTALELVTAKTTVFVVPTETASAVYSNGTGGGNFATGATWSGGSVPDATDDVVIRPGDTVTATGSTSFRRLYVRDTGTFDAGASAIAVASGGAIYNNGTFTSTGAITSAADVQIWGDVACGSLSAGANLTVGEGGNLAAASGISVVGTTTNHGILAETKPIASGPGSHSFDAAGVTVDFLTTGALTELTVAEKADSRIEPSGRYYTLTPNGAGFVYSLTLPHSIAPDTDAEICQFDSNALLPTGAGCGRTSSTSTTVTRSGLTNMSDWGVFENGSVPVELDGYDVQ